MFLITPKPTFKRHVEMHVPGEDEPGKANFTFKYLNAEQLAEWQNKYGKSPLIDGLKEVVLGWAEIQDEQGNEVEFSHENLKQLLIDYPASGQEITQTFLRETLGARRKN